VNKLNTQYGWVGKILKVDLSTDKIYEIETKKYQDFIGGVGIAAKIFFDEVSPEVGPLDPENQLAFMTGPLTGTMIPGSGRAELCSRSPTPYPKPAWTYSGFGGGWPAELKFSGYDGVIIEGKSAEPVYLTIFDKQTEIREAHDLWGLDAFETQKKISEKFGDPEILSMVIGPAGENLVIQSIVLNETSSAAGYGGMGAVMGSKNLKAVAVRGSGDVKIANPEDFLPLMNKLRDAFGYEGIWEYDNEPFAHGKDRYGRARYSNLDKKYFKYLDGAGSGAAANGHHLHNSSCIGCYFACKGYFAYPGLPSGTAHCGQWWFASIRSPSDAGMSAADEDAWLANILANQLGLNIFENAMVARWFKDCVNEGIITEEHMPLPEFLGGKASNSEFIRTYLNDISYRTGFSSRFSDGCMKGAETLGPRALHLFKKQTTARGIKSHHDTPLAYLIWAMDSRDPLNSVHDDNAIFYTKENTKYHLGYHATGWSYNLIPQIAIKLQHSKDLKNSLPLCDWAYPLIAKDKKTNSFIGKEFPALLFSNVTGIEVNEKSLEIYGERITNIIRAIMVTEKRTIHEDDIDQIRYEIPIRVRRGSNEKALVDKEKFNEAKIRYYKLRGWDTETGRPTNKKLKDLGLHDVQDKLKKLGLIPY
jgi:aldehyde:ferredoxin oxidoreductase